MTPADTEMNGMDGDGDHGTAKSAAGSAAAGTGGAGNARRTDGAAPLLTAAC